MNFFGEFFPMCEVIIFLFSHDLVGSNCAAVLGLCRVCLCLGTEPQDQLAWGTLLQVNFSVGDGFVMGRLGSASI